MFDEKRSEISGTPLVSENVPNKTQNVPRKKKPKYMGHHLLVKMSLINHKMFHEKKNTWDTTC